MYAKDLYVEYKENPDAVTHAKDKELFELGKLNAILENQSLKTTKSHGGRKLLPETEYPSFLSFSSDEEE